MEGTLSGLRHGKSIIIAGDFNVHFNTDRPETVGLCDVLSGFNLIQTIFEPTRGENCLDNIFLGGDLRFSFAGVLDFCISDHAAQLLTCEVDLQEHGYEVGEKVLRPITQRGKNMFFVNLSKYNWFFVNDHSMSADARFEEFVRVLEREYLLCFPEKKYKVRTDQYNHITWYTNQLREMREHLYFLRDLSKMYVNNFALKEQFKSFKRTYKLAIREAKMEANDNLIRSSNNPIKCMWQLIKKSSTDEKLSEKSSLKPDDFNDFFTNIANEIIKSIPPPIKDPLELCFKYDIVPPEKEFVFSEVTFNEVRNVIDSLKNKNSKDKFGLNVGLIKNIKNVILSPLTRLINLCIRDKLFPSILKKAIVVPIFKKGDPNDPVNYRPISLLPIISKIVEKCLSNQLIAFFEENNFFSNCQFGFRKGKNTVQGIESLVDDIMNSFNDLQYNTVTSCDLSKAFDCVNHSILLQKLSRYHMSPEGIALIESYLVGRSQSVRIGGVESAEGDLTVGVPQGSILGPLLFLIYINDLPSVAVESKFVLFADDTTFSVSDDSLTESLDRSDAERKRVDEWFRANQLALNNEKTNRVVFTLRTVVNDGSEVPTLKFLGLQLDQGLQWGCHTEALASRLCKSLFLLRSLSNRLSLHVLKTAYYASFHSHLSYGILIWGHAAGSQRVFGLQRKALRIIAGLDYRGDCRETFRTLRILTVPSLFILESLLFVKRNINNFKTHTEVHSHDTRGRHNLVPAFQRLKRCQSGPGYWGIKYFNALPDNIKVMDFNNFKKETKELLINKVFYSIDDFTSGVG